jgi:hypothetical protein
MPQQNTIEIPRNTWTQITNADAASVTFLVLGNAPVYIAGAADTSLPTSTEGALRYQSGEGERNVELSALFPGVDGVVRLFAYSAKKAQVVVSHA